MKSSKTSLLLLVVWATTTLADQIAKPSDAGNLSETGSQKIARTVNLVEYSPGIYRPSVDLGTIRRGARIDLALTLLNASDKSIHLGDAIADCGCISITASNATIETGESRSVKLELKPIRSPKTRSWLQYVSFETDDKRGTIRLQLTATIEGVLRFTKDFTTVNFDPGRRDILHSREILIQHSPPVLSKNLIAMAASHHDYFKLDIAPETDHSSILRIQISNGKELSKGFVTSIAVIDPVTRYQDEILCTVMPYQAIEVMPSRLSIRLNDSTGGSGSLMIIRRNTEGEKQRANDEFNDDAVHVDVQCDSLKIVNVRLTGKGRARRLRFDAERKSKLEHHAERLNDIKDDQNDIVVVITWGKLRRQFTVPVQLLQ